MRTIFLAMDRGTAAHAAPVFGASVVLLGLIACGPSSAGRPTGQAKAASATPIPVEARGSTGGGSTKACVAEFEASDIRAAVKRDLARGEKRFFRVWAEEKSVLAAPGIAGCLVPDAKAARTSPINAFDDGRYYLPEDARQCRFAIYNYKIRYNQELARELGPSMGTNCSGKRGKIDPYDKPFDFKAYRTRMAKVANN